LELRKLEFLSIKIFYSHKQLKDDMNVKLFFKILFVFIIVKGNSNLFPQINIKSGTTVNIKSGTYLVLRGNYSNGGTLNALTGSIISFRGSGTQTISKTGGEIFSSLLINKPSGDISLNTNLLINGTLTLTSGKVITNAGNLLTLGSAPIISGGSGTSFINGPLARTVATTSLTSNIFPIGKGAIYRPLTLTLQQATATSTVYTAEQKEGAPISRTLPGSLDNISSVRYYNIVKGTGASVSTASVKLSYDADDVVPDATVLRIAKDNGTGAWIDIGGTGTANTTGTITSTINFTSFSDFVLAKNTGRVLSLTALIQGFYNGGVMTTDTVAVELHNATSPYALVESKKGVLNTAGAGTFTFKTGMNGISYYIVVRHRNSIETWSASGNTFSASTLSYNLTSAQSQAYGSNLVLKGAKWCIFGGDVNQDGGVDLYDLSAVDNDNANFATGYVNTDVNGDGIVDLFDLSIVDNNNNAFIGKVVPTGTSAIKGVKQSLKLEEINK
jgi:hypothetical protein